MGEYTLPSKVTPAAQAAYDAWVAQNRNRYGSALYNAFLDGYLARDKDQPPAVVAPAWDALSHHDQLDHIDFCDGCDLCADGRGFGACTSCGSDPVEALPPHGESRCCGSQVSMRGDQL